MLSEQQKQKISKINQLAFDIDNEIQFMIDVAKKKKNERAESAVKLIGNNFDAIRKESEIIIEKEMPIANDESYNNNVKKDLLDELKIDKSIVKSDDQISFDVNIDELCDINRHNDEPLPKYISVKIFFKNGDVKDLSLKNKEEMDAMFELRSHKFKNLKSDKGEAVKEKSSIKPKNKTSKIIFILLNPILRLFKRKSKEKAKRKK